MERGGGLRSERPQSAASIALAEALNDPLRMQVASFGDLRPSRAGHDQLQPLGK